MAELEILFPKIAIDAVTTTVNDEDPDFPHENLFRGGSNTIFRRNSNGTQTTIDFDLGSGNTQTIDFAYFRGANLLIAEADAEVDLSIHASTDNFSASDVTILSISDIESSDLTGTYNEDILLTGTTSTAYRYWRIQIDSDTSFKHVLRACYFGNRRTLGRSPSFPYSGNFQDQGNRFQADSGSMYSSSSGRLGKQYSFNWQAITDANRDTFEDEVAKYKYDVPVVLYEPSGGLHLTLNGKETVFGWFENQWQSVGPKAGFNAMKLDFIEDLA